MPDKETKPINDQIYLIRRNGGKLERVTADKNRLDPEFPYPIVTMKTLEKLRTKYLDDPDITTIIYQRVKGKVRILCLGPISKSINLANHLLYKHPEIGELGPICRKYATRDRRFFRHPSVLF